MQWEDKYGRERREFLLSYSHNVSISLNRTAKHDKQIYYVLSKALVNYSW